MNYKVLLDVVMPEPAGKVTDNTWWIIAFIVIALIIAVTSVIVIRKSVKKAKKNAEQKVSDVKSAADEASKE